MNTQDKQLAALLKAAKDVCGNWDHWERCRPCTLRILKLTAAIQAFEGEA